ncbi:MAG: hypothetical protein OHK0011_19550 [Turneriella sp.]
MHQSYKHRICLWQPLIWVITLTFAFSSTLHAEDATEGWVIPSAGLNLRDAPDASGKRIATIPFNEKVQVLEKSDKYVTIDKIYSRWWKIRWKDKEGWAFGAYVAEKGFLLLTPTTLATEFKGGCLAAASNDGSWRCEHSCQSGSIYFGADGSYFENPQVGAGCTGEARQGKWVVKGNKIIVNGQDEPLCCESALYNRCAKNPDESMGGAPETCAICLSEGKCPARMSPEAYAKKYAKTWRLEYQIQKNGTFILKKTNYGRMFPLEAR